MPCPYCGHLLPKDAESCDRCDWTHSGATETAEGKASDAVAVILSVIPGLGHIHKGHKLAGFLWMAGAIPVGIFVFLAAIASADSGSVSFSFTSSRSCFMPTQLMIASWRPEKMRAKSTESVEACRAARAPRVIASWRPRLFLCSALP